jgi:hypothetical protein
MSIIISLLYGGTSGDFYGVVLGTILKCEVLKINSEILYTGQLGLKKHEHFFNLRAARKKIL